MFEERKTMQKCNVHCRNRYNGKCMFTELEVKHNDPDCWNVWQG